MEEQLVAQRIDLPAGGISVLQPYQSAEPPVRELEWAPLVPCWSVLWHSGVPLPRELAALPLAGTSVVELGCGLGMPGLVAVKSGARVLAADADPDALELVRRSAELNRLEVETAVVDWSAADELIASLPFDLVLAADVLYERPSVAQLLRLLAPLGIRALIADSARPAPPVFPKQGRTRWAFEPSERGVVRIHRIQLDGGMESPAQ